MDLSTSIRTVYYKKYADFKGRASRSEYWWAMGFYYAITFVIYFVGYSIYPEYLDVGFFEPTGIDTVADLFNLIVLIPMIAVTYRRLHDINMSGWWFWLWLPPFIIWFFVAVYAMFVEMPPEVLFDETAVPDFWLLFNNNAFIVSLISWVLPMLYVSIYLPLKIGDKEANLFGEAPID